MRTAVLGPAGSLGSHVTLELLNRGHEVVGISNSPENLGKHERYHPRPVDLNAGSIEQLVDILRGVDVVVNAYNPRINIYQNLLEATRRIIKAVKSLTQDGQGPYLIMIGGTGSLQLPDQPLVTPLDDRSWWLRLRNTMADSAAATAYMVERMDSTGPVAESFQTYRNARLAITGDRSTASPTDLETIKMVENAILHGEEPVPELPLAGRAAFMMFEGNTSFRWSFLSPPAKFRPGARTGLYQVWKNELPMSSKESAMTMPMDWSKIEQCLLGISIADLAIAIAAEAERQQKVSQHWSAVGELVDDMPRESGIRL